MPLLSTFGAASTRGFGNLSGIAIPVDDLFNTVSFLSHFDGTNNGVNNVFDDSSSSNHTITANGNVTQGSFGPFARPDGEWGVALDGSGDYLTLPANSLDVSNNNFTLESWVYTTVTGERCVVGAVRNSDGSGAYMLNINYNSAQVRFFCRYNGGTVLDYTVGSGDFPTNAWTHLAVTRDGANLRVFINGTQVGTTNTTLGSFAIDNASLNGGIYYIGRTTDGASQFTGNLSNLRVVIGTAVYTSNFTPSSSPLTAITNTDFLGCQSNRFVDNSTSAHTITASGDAAVSAFGPFLTSSVYDAGANGASAYFDGTGDYITLSPTSDFAFGTGDFSVSLWAYFTDVGAYDYLIDARNSGQTASTWALSFNYTNGAPNKLQFASGGTAILTSNTNVQADQWYYISVSRIGTTSKMHFNGVEVASNSSDSTNYSTAPNTSYIGSRHSVEHFFDGYISDLRVVKGTGLSSYTPPTAPLTAVTDTKLLLNMADGQAIDSAAQNNLTLYGDAKISSTQSKFGGTSIYFDGTGDEAKYSSRGFGTGDFTMEAWVYPESQLQRFPAVYYVTNGSTNRVAVAFDHDSQPDKFRCNVAGTVLAPAGTNAENQWYHTAVVRYQGVVTFYINGTSVGSTSYTHDVAPEESFLGGNTPRSSELNFKGYIDDFRVSNTARYTSNFTPPTEPFADKGQ